MAIVDADTHVIESERTWEFMGDHEQDFRPFVVVPKSGEANLSGGFSGRRIIVTEYWVIEGRRRIIVTEYWGRSEKVQLSLGRSRRRGC